jgi:murein DD-endopeptidase MepM/ murein hydrolase activator NlpD
MQSEKVPERFSWVGGESSRKKISEDRETASLAKNASESRVLSFLEGLNRLDLAETALRVGTHMLSIALVLLVVWVMREFYFKAQMEQPPRSAAFAASLPTATPQSQAPELPKWKGPGDTYTSGIPRLALIHTTIPSRPRTEVITYTVQKGDTVFGIAEKFGLKPETILWGNYYTLADNPHALSPGQKLNIMPSDGVYHKWSAGEGLNGVANGYGVTVDDIINYPGNHLSREALGNLSNPNIEPGTFLFVPGGSRQMVTWSAPQITRSKPAVAKYIGPGACEGTYDGYVGTGAFIWPSAHHYLSGYDYSPSTNHFAIDIDADMGDAIWAADSGVVVYAGWNNFGYGNMVVIDHGNGWQTAYAHMSSISVVCGQSVLQGDLIGAVGSTGKSSGPHIHFEMLNDNYGKVNPHDFLPP